MPTLRQLTYLRALAGASSFRAAAEACHVSQPALSTQIRDLEAELGVVLVERSANGIRLTADGAEAQRRATAILAAVHDLATWAKSRSTAVEGTLRLGVIPSIGPYLLPRLLPLLARRYPALRLQLRETQTAALVERLQAGDLDAVLLALPVEGPDLVARSLFDDVFLLAAPRSGVAAPSEPVDPERLTDANLLLLEEGHCLRDQAMSYCRNLDPEAARTFGASSLATIMEMVAAGFGVTLLPAMAADLEGRNPDVALLRFKQPEPRRTIGLVWRRSSHRAERLEHLAVLVREAAGGQPPEQRQLA